MINEAEGLLYICDKEGEHFWLESTRFREIPEWVLKYKPTDTKPQTEQFKRWAQSHNIPEGSDEAEKIDDIIEQYMREKDKLRSLNWPDTAEIVDGKEYLNGEAPRGPQEKTPLKEILDKSVWKDVDTGGDPQVWARKEAIRLDKQFFADKEVAKALKRAEKPLDAAQIKALKEPTTNLLSVPIKDGVVISKATRYNNTKPRVGLIDYKSLIPLVRVLEYGADKYTRDNWKEGHDKIELLESLIRHATALIDAANESKSEVDESGIHHIGHIMANCMFYSYHFLDADEKE